MPSKRNFRARLDRIEARLEPRAAFAASASQELLRELTDAELERLAVLARRVDNGESVSEEEAREFVGILDDANRRLNACKN